MAIGFDSFTVMVPAEPVLVGVGVHLESQSSSLLVHSTHAPDYEIYSLIVTASPEMATCLDKALMRPVIILMY